MKLTPKALAADAATLKARIKGMTREEQVLHRREGTPRYLYDHPDGLLGIRITIHQRPLFRWFRYDCMRHEYVLCGSTMTWQCASRRKATSC